MINKKRLIFIIALGALFFSPAHPVQGKNQSSTTLLSHSQEIEEAVDAATLFMEAHKYYNEEKYDQAAPLYEKLIQSGIRNGAIYYNLGNSYFKMGMLGKAILSYRLAELHLPRDEDLKANLSYARQLTKDRIEEKQFLPFLKEFCFWYSKLNLKELIIVFLIAHGIFWIVAIIRTFWKKEHQNLILLINLVLVVIIGCSLTLKIYNHIYNIEGIVLTKEITVRSGNGTNNTALFQLHDGAEFKIIKQDKDWIKIELKDGKRGWVESRWVGKYQL
jgi:tetratricopeptide (TPR) repeat protein